MAENKVIDEVMLEDSNMKLEIEDREKKIQELVDKYFRILFQDDGNNPTFEWLPLENVVWFEHDILSREEWMVLKTVIDMYLSLIHI